MIEIHGDFWHGNPRTWGSDKPLCEHQKMKQLDDAVKKNLVERDGYNYVVFWEYDVLKDSVSVIEKTRKLMLT
jgi:G:T-mismatch repair DNA endonuclease (very short patch repair protein)